MNALTDKYLKYKKKYGTTVKINSIDSIGFFREIEDKANSIDTKYFYSDLGTVNQGDIIEHTGISWLVISKGENLNEVHEKAVVQKCQYSIKITFEGNVKSFPATFDTKTMDTTTNQYMSLAANKMSITIQNNVDSKDIETNQRFINTERAWKITGLDKSKEGLITLTCDLDLFNPIDDDVVNEIADRWKYETVHNYSLEISNGATGSVNIDSILNLSAVVLDNGLTVSNPSLTYLSSDSNVVAVDNTGKCIGIGVGTATITVQMTLAPTIKDTIVITVQEAPVSHNYTLSITGGATIKAIRTGSYVSHIFDNGVEVFDKSATWSIRNQDGTGTLYANITASTGNSSTITAGNSYNKYVVLRAILVDDVSKYAEFTVKIVSLV